jgi:hypothetical protein
MKAAICLTFLICLSCLALIAKQPHRAPEGFEDEKAFIMGTNYGHQPRSSVDSVSPALSTRACAVHITDTLLTIALFIIVGLLVRAVLGQEIITHLQSSRLSLFQNTGEVIYDGERGFPRSRLPDLSAGTRLNARGFQRLSSPNDAVSDCH